MYPRPSDEQWSVVRPALDILAKRLQWAICFWNHFLPQEYAIHAEYRAAHKTRADQKEEAASPGTWPTARDRWLAWMECEREGLDPESPEGRDFRRQRGIPVYEPSPEAQKLLDKSRAIPSGPTDDEILATLRLHGLSAEADQIVMFLGEPIHPLPKCDIAAQTLSYVNALLDSAGGKKSETAQEESWALDQKEQKIRWGIERALADKKAGKPVKMCDGRVTKKEVAERVSRSTDTVGDTKEWRYYHEHGMLRPLDELAEADLAETGRVQSLLEKVVSKRPDIGRRIRQELDDLVFGNTRNDYTEKQKLLSNALNESLNWGLKTFPPEKQVEEAIQTLEGLLGCESNRIHRQVMPRGYKAPYGEAGAPPVSVQEYNADCD